MSSDQPTPVGWMFETPSDVLLAKGLLRLLTQRQDDVELEAQVELEDDNED